MRCLLRLLFLCGLVLILLHGEQCKVAYAQQDIIGNNDPKLLIEQEELILLVGEKQQINLTIEGFYEGSVTYLSGNSDVVTIDHEGIIIAQREGKCDITVSLDNGDSRVIHAVVVEYIARISILYMNGADQVTLAVGQSRIINTEVEITESLKNELVTDLVFTSMDNEIASVDSEGKITGKKVGKTEILIQLNSDPRAEYILDVTITKRKSKDALSEKKLDVVGVKHAKYTYKEMKGDLKKLEDIYGDRIKVSSLGQSYDKRKIYLVRLGNPSAKRKILIQGAIHGREYMTAQLIMKQIEYYCKNYYSGFYNGQYLSELFDKCEFYIIPMMNPDGVTISQFGAAGIQNKKLRNNIISICKKEGGKKRADYYTRWKANARGVDLNRNFDTNWTKFNDKRSGPASREYKGKKAESEKETQLLVELYQQIKPSITISYHATGSVIFSEYGQKGKLSEKSKAWLKRIKKLTGYTSVSNKNGKNNVPGFGDWIVREKKAVSLTLEIGKKACPLKSSEFKKIWEKNKVVLLILAKYK